MSSPSESGRDFTVNAIRDVLLPLCDDLPGEPLALIAWSPDVLAERISDGLAANGLCVIEASLVQTLALLLEIDER